MQHWGIVGTTFRRHQQAGVEAFQIHQNLQASLLPALHTECQFVESVFLATCNRVEFIFAGEPGVSVGTYRERVVQFFQKYLHLPSDHAAAYWLHAYEGEGAAEHLFEIAASVDAMNPGDAQILGQVKQALFQSKSLGLVGPQLDILFQEAFETAKHVREKTKLGHGTVSMVSLAADAVEQALQKHARPCLAMVGAGPMTLQWADMFSEHSIERLFVNRTLEKAQALAETYHGTAMALHDFIQHPPTVHALVTATSSTEPIFELSFFERCKQPISIVVDLAIPRDVHPHVHLQSNMQVYDIDRLHNIAQQSRAQRLEHIADARLLIDMGLASLRKKMASRQASELIASFRDMYQKETSQSVEKLLQCKHMKNITHEQRIEIEKWSRALANKLCHHSTLGLKALAFEYGSDAVDCFFHHGVES